MKTLKIRLVSIILILIFAGCNDIIEKDELTFPTTVHFQIGIERPNWAEVYSEYPYTEYFTFTEGQIGIQKIQFEGRREAGEDVFFETDPRTSFQTIFAPDEYIAQPQALVASFNIPQGIYDYIKWDIYLKKIAKDEYIEDFDTDSQNTGLIIKGFYVKEWWDWWYADVPDSSFKIPFILAANDTELLSIMTSMTGNPPQLLIKNNKDYRAVLLLNLPYAFETISRESIEATDISGEGEQQKIIISSSKNKDLYEIILFRLALSSNVYFH
jgi:hypothetical protein